MRTAWSEAPLRRVLQRRRVANDDRRAPLLSLTIEGATVLRGGEDGLGQQAPSDGSIANYVLVEPGQLVVNPMWLVGGSIGVATLAGAVSPAYRVYQPLASIEPRFLHHFVRSARSRAAYRMLGRGETTFDRAVSAEDFESLLVRWPELDEQRRIADFLDDQVVRIDRIIAARREQAELAGQIPWANFGRSLVGVQAVPLRRAIRSLADGPFGSAFSSSDYVDEGPAVIRLGNIGFSEFREGDLARVPMAIYERFPRAHVQAGDLLIASLGDANNHAGRACLAPVDLGDAMVKGKCFVGKANPSVASDRFMAILLSSPLGAQSLVQQGTGATRSMLNFERLLSCRLPMPGKHDQDARVQAFENERDSVHRTVSDLTRSIELLTEYKCSLIVAAVTGDLDVTTAGSGGPA